MTETEKAIRDFCGHHADWWPSTTQVQEMLALAQPEQEPAIGDIRALKHRIHTLEGEVIGYKRILDAQPEQEPLEYWNAVEGWVKIDEVREHFDSVGCGTIYKTAGEDRVPVYTTPPQRKPLSDEEIYSLADSLEIWNEDDEEWILDPNTFARAIEAAHGIKETEK